MSDLRQRAVELALGALELQVGTLELQQAMHEAASSHVRPMHGNGGPGGRSGVTVRDMDGTTAALAVGLVLGTLVGVLAVLVGLKFPVKHKHR